MPPRTFAKTALTTCVTLAFLVPVLALFYLIGCSTTQMSPAPPPPVYMQVAHPESMDLKDLYGIFSEPKAPKPNEFARTCDSDFLRLISQTRSKGEIEDGAKELIKTEPLNYHWCFYSKLYALEENLKKESFLDEKQKQVLDTYEFLGPIARAFASEYHDSRYLRWAVVRYQKISAWAFFRKLELTPAGTAELVHASNPFGVWRKNPEKMPILEKYGLSKPLAVQQQPVQDSEAFTPIPTVAIQEPVPFPSGVTDHPASIETVAVASSEPAPTPVPMPAQLTTDIVPASEPSPLPLVPTTEPVNLAKPEQPAVAPVPAPPPQAPPKPVEEPAPDIPAFAPVP